MNHCLKILFFFLMAYSTYQILNYSEAHYMVYGLFCHHGFSIPSILYS